MAAPDAEEKRETLAPEPSHEPPREPEEHGGGGGGGRDLQPWEQHAAVISLPRYDYRAPGSLLLHSHSGFLITCPIKREKSATKEAISILEEYIDHVISNNCESSEPCDLKLAAKKRKIRPKVSRMENSEDVITNGSKNASESTGKVEECSSPHSKSSENVERTSNLSLVKLSRSGLLFFSLPHGGFHNLVQMLGEIFLSLRSGKLKCPQWCHRILPIQETCLLSETELHATVSKLFQEFSRDKEDQAKPIKFAVGYNRRGIDETEMKAQKNDNAGSNQQALMGRELCFKVAAAAVKSVVENSVVDLKSPEVVVLVEALPLSGVPHGSSVAGVSLLPAELISTKPRLCVKSLVSDTKATKK